ncbi:MAG TPA: hypothetical protein VEJ18_00420 [Planctomycetota bacterium]|nr:hypothetical protein [Planctomycetota bacterium]
MFRYESASKVGVSPARAILSETAAIERAWWNGALGFDVDDPEHPVVLQGGVKLFRSDVTMEDDLFLAFADMAAIVERLIDWAARYKVKWRLHMHDEDWGTIDPQGISQQLLDQLEKWAKRAKVVSSGKAKWFIPEARREELLARHRKP